MNTRVVTMRVPENVLVTYKALAELTGISVAEALRETLVDAEPTVAELVRLATLARGGDTVGFFDGLRATAEAYQQQAAGLAGNAAEAGNEVKAKRVRGKRPVEVER